MALAASALLAAGATSAQAAGDSAAAAPRPAAVAEVRTFTGSGMGVYPSDAVDGAVRMAYTMAQWAGWQVNQCHVRATSVRSVGGGLYSAVADLFCQR
ncbi:hypothetical protein ACFVIM_10905 [Streptomyces sp. NPDC057638]|uniref:hypothetical protein n=1 Tax=Streptomyces sp. NPDC057638 TaxID=3346190 RepID=UPI0036C2B28F